MLSGHTDVVPVLGQNWTVPPFAMTESIWFISPMNPATKRLMGRL